MYCREIFYTSWKWFGSRNKRAEGLSPSPLFVETSLLRERGQWIYGGKNSPTRHVSPSYNFGETILALEGLEEGERRGHGPGRSSYALLPTTTTRTTPRPFGQWVTRCVCLPPPSLAPLLLELWLSWSPLPPPSAFFNHRSTVSFFSLDRTNRDPSIGEIFLLPRILKLKLPALTGRPNRSTFHAYIFLPVKRKGTFVS